LVGNAADAIGEGGRVRVAVEAVHFEAEHPLAHQHFDTAIPPGTFAWVSVSDNGPGIPPEIKARLFEPFVSTKEPAPGRGLGLAVVYGIARAVGWYVDAESKTGCTVFSVYLPLADPAEAEPSSPADRGGS
jgi:signal transduction histidine kinase